MPSLTRGIYSFAKPVRDQNFSSMPGLKTVALVREGLMYSARTRGLLTTSPPPEGTGLAAVGWAAWDAAD